MALDWKSQSVLTAMGSGLSTESRELVFRAPAAPRKAYLHEHD